MYTKNTKIVCTLGPSSNSISEITKLVQAGMNVARLNFSHGDYKTHQELIDNLRQVEKMTGKKIGIMQDLQGPKIRLGDLAKSFEVKRGDICIITSEKKIHRNRFKKSTAALCLPIQFKNFTKGLKKNDHILINDGLIEVKVLEVNKNQAKCLVKAGGVLKSRAGVHLPTISENIGTITQKDKRDLKFGLKNNLDYIALSFVKTAKDIIDLKKLIKREGKSTKVVAKIELKSAVENLEGIVQVTDGLMVARGDLGIDIPAEKVPIIQKRIINLANKYGKPVITATEVLLSMVTSPRATRAEVSDAANAVFDHTDAIMLSNESATGKYPAKATATLSKVAISVEQEMQKYEDLSENIYIKRHKEDSNPHCLNACELAINTKSDYLVVYTSDGYSAREIAKHRIYIPIITITESEQTSRELTLVWGLNKIFTHKIAENNHDKVKEILKFLKAKKVVKKSDKLIIICNASKKEQVISNIKI